ncbi:hypothetical protein A6P39_044545 (plasmid) [Streptomyces sp. FXJ1.172]|jgi:hypothetical protein|uniref:hypothetical protein n=1 Tax=Streptomyces sp. FXJ1.172 TaxID=710705 RepID=UPI0023DD253C|nr:hypothetical protein [Streptomyces sp. FXJ1.172]WEP01090.1 hypothetical protein A6P39_044545 [Streptomyces sp. FXJ1.172]
MSDARLSTDALRQSVVEQLMRLVGLPDDETAAREADETLLALDARLGEEATLPTGSIAA